MKSIIHFKLLKTLQVCVIWITNKFYLLIQSLLLKPLVLCSLKSPPLNLVHHFIHVYQVQFQFLLMFQKLVPFKQIISGVILLQVIKLLMFIPIHMLFGNLLLLDFTVQQSLTNLKIVEFGVLIINMAHHHISFLLLGSCVQFQDLQISEMVVQSHYQI